MKRSFWLQHVLILSVLIVLHSCNEEQNNQSKNLSNNSDTTVQLIDKPIIDKVLTEKEQQLLTPEMVIQSFKDGNDNFINNNLTKRDHSSLVVDAAYGQHPKAMVLSCIDSRVPVEDVFNKGIGDIFVGRVAGNIVNEDLLGSMEYACKVAGAKVIFVMGHGSCGAVKSAIDDVKVGNITALLSKIRPAVTLAEDYTGEKKSKNYDYVDYVAKRNISNTIETIRKKSSILKELEDKKEIKIIGTFYNIKNGKVEFL